MIDIEHNARRFITEFSNETDELLAEYDLASFDLKLFQIEFAEGDASDPMYYCYPIKEENIAFLKKYLSEELDWDFVNKAYFVEAEEA